MIVVSDSSPIILFAKIDRLDILEKLYGTIYIPKEVYNEITFNKELEDTKIIQNCTFLKVENVEYSDISKIENINNIKIHKGEEAAIALALKKNCDCLILDDKNAKKVAQKNDITVIGTVGLIAALRENDLISKEIEKDYLILLKENGLYMDDVLVNKIINKSFSEKEINKLTYVMDLDSIQKYINENSKNEELNNKNITKTINDNKRNNNNIHER